MSTCADARRSLEPLGTAAWHRGIPRAVAMLKRRERAFDDHETRNEPAINAGSARTSEALLKAVGDCRHKDDGALTMSSLVLSTMANNSLCSASGTSNFAIVSSKSLQKAAHSLSVILRCL
jgi:hypothetical protein